MEWNALCILSIFPLFPSPLKVSIHGSKLKRTSHFQNPSQDMLSIPLQNASLIFLPPTPQGCSLAQRVAKKISTFGFNFQFSNNRKSGKTLGGGGGFWIGNWVVLVSIFSNRKLKIWNWSSMMRPFPSTSFPFTLRDMPPLHPWPPKVVLSSRVVWKILSCKFWCVKVLHFPLLVFHFQIFEISRFGSSPTYLPSSKDKRVFFFLRFTPKDLSFGWSFREKFCKLWFSFSGHRKSRTPRGVWG